MVHLLIFVGSLFLAAGAYAWGWRPTHEKWELLRKLSNGKLGLYKRREHLKFGKFERAFATYAVMRNASPEKRWSFVWRVDRIARGGRFVGLRSAINIVENKNLHEVGFSPPLGLYTVYTGEEDHLSYPEREQHLLALYKETAPNHKDWRDDPAFSIRRVLSRWRLAFFVFVGTAVTGLAVAPIGVEAPQLIAWTLVAVMALGLPVGIVCVIKTKDSVMWLQASGAAILVACVVSASAAPSLFLAINGLSFSTLCEGSVMVERSWTEGTSGNAVHYADVPLPKSCQFDAQKTPITPALYAEFQAGRRSVDIVVSEGLLGYKRIKLIGL